MISSAFAGQLLSVACYNEPNNPSLESRRMRDRATVRETHFKAFSRSWRVLSGTEGPPPREVFWINRSAATPSSRALSSTVGALHCQLLQTAVAGAEVLLGASEGHQTMPSLVTRRLCSMSGSGCQSGRFYRAGLGVCKLLLWSQRVPTGRNRMLLGIAFRRGTPPRTGEV